MDLKLLPISTSDESIVALVRNRQRFDLSECEELGVSGTVPYVLLSEMERDVLVALAEKSLAGVQQQGLTGPCATCRHFDEQATETSENPQVTPKQLTVLRMWAAEYQKLGSDSSAAPNLDAESRHWKLVFADALTSILAVYDHSLAEPAAAPSIDCPLCGETVQQVASATLSLALWQHVNWKCSRRN